MHNPDLQPKIYYQEANNIEDEVDDSTKPSAYSEPMEDVTSGNQEHNKHSHVCPSDEIAYQNYLEALTDIKDAYATKIMTAEEDLKWYTQKLHESNYLRTQLGGTAQIGPLPHQPYRNIVENSLSNAKKHINDRERLEQDIRNAREEYRAEEKSIRETRQTLAIGVVVYAIGVFACGAITHNAAAAFLWPVIAAIVLGIGAVILNGA